MVIMTEKSIRKAINVVEIERNLNISRKITLFLTTWILIMFFLTGMDDFETFFILMFIGMILAQELADEFSSLHLKHRMYFFISLFLIIFILLVGNRLITFLGE